MRLGEAERSEPLANQSVFEVVLARDIAHCACQRVRVCVCVHSPLKGGGIEEKQVLAVLKRSWVLNNVSHF